MATTYAGRYSKAFARIWSAHGSPTLSIVDPVSGWTLDPGVTYDAYQDQFIDSEGAVTAVSWSGQPATSANFIPTRKANMVELSIGGMATEGDISRNVVIEWSSTLQTKIAACYGVVISSSLYHVKSWEVYPMGTSAPVEIRLELSDA